MFDARTSPIPGITHKIALLATLAAGCDPPQEPAALAGGEPAATDHRIDPEAARELSDAEFRALGRERSTVHGAGTAQAAATRRYVSAAGGSDHNDGTRDAPWRTVQHAADVAEPGTTVLVDDSAEYAGGLELRRSGEPGAYIIFRNHDAGRMPRLAGASNRDAVVDIDASYVVFQGFEIAGHERESLRDDAIGIKIEPRDGDISHVEVRNNLVHHVGPGQVDRDACDYNGHGIIARAEGFSITDLVLDANELHHLYVGNSECLVVNGNVHGFAVTNNYVHDVNNIAIDIIGYEKNRRETPTQGVVADNVVLDASNYWPYCSRGNCTYPEGDESSDGIYVDGGAELVIEYNVVGRADHGIELQSENGEPIRDVEVRFNVVFNSNYKHLTLGETERSTAHDNVLFDAAGLVDRDLEECKP